MKQRIGTLNTDKPVSDTEAVFFAMYNLIAEKLEEEPNKGIIISKGNPNQRKVRWKDLMEMSHRLEDYFTMRAQLTGNGTCENCAHWKSISQASPHIGKCDKRNKTGVHCMSSCRKFLGRS